LRTKEEILARKAAYGGDETMPEKSDCGPYTLMKLGEGGKINVEDPLGARRETLDSMLGFPDAVVKEYLQSALAFGCTKAGNHRGISAGIAISKIAEVLWMLGDNEMQAFAEDDRNYENYGVPILKKVAGRYGFELPKNIAEWEDGKPCHPGCEEGCSKGIFS